MSESAIHDPVRSAPTAGTYAALSGAFVAFIVYGSLVPFQYRVLPLDEAVALFQVVCARPVGVDSWSDWVTNVILYAPLGFLLMAATCVDRSWSRGLLLAVLVLPCCSLLSAAMEFSQLFFPPRVSSLNDIVTNTSGSLLGILAWLAAGQRLTGLARRLWAAVAAQGLSARLLPGYLVLLFFVHAMPLDLTIRPADLYHKYRDGLIRLVPFVPGAVKPLDFVQAQLWEVIYFLPVGLLLSRLPGSAWRQGRAWPRVLIVGLLTAGAVEFMKLFVESRFCATDNVITGTLAVLAGWGLGVAWGARRRPLTDGDGAAAWLPSLRHVLLLAWLAAVLFLSWKPFDFTTDAAVAGRRLHTVTWVPLADYQQATPYQAFDQWLHKTILFLPLGGLLAAWPGRRWTTVPVLAVAALLAIIVAAGQLFVPGRYPSVSNVLIETGGAWLGFLLVRHAGEALRPSALYGSKHEYCR